MGVMLRVMVPIIVLKAQRPGVAGESKMPRRLLQLHRTISRRDNSIQKVIQQPTSHSQDYLSAAATARPLASVEPGCGDG